MVSKVGRSEREREREEIIFLQIRRRARGLSCASEVVVKVFVGLNGREEVIVSERDALCRRESVGHPHRVFNLYTARLAKKEYTCPQSFSRGR